MCGLPPYTADRLIDVSVIDGASRSASPSTSSGRCASRPRRASRCSPPGARCSRCRAPTPTARSRPRSASSRTRSARAGALAVDVGDQRPPRTAPDRGRRRRAGRDRLLLVRARRDDDARRSTRGGCSTRSARGTSRRGATAPTPSACSASTASARCAPPASTSTRVRAPTTTTPRPRVPPAARRPARHAPARARRPTGWSRATRTSPPSRRADGSWQVVLAVSETAWLERLLAGPGPGRDGRRPAASCSRLGGRRPPTGSGAATGIT